MTPLSTSIHPLLTPPGEQPALRLYARSIAMLAPDQRAALAVAASGVVVAMVQLAEPVLFSRVVDALAEGSGAFGVIAVWAGLSIAGLAASVAVPLPPTGWHTAAASRRSP